MMAIVGTFGKTLFANFCRILTNGDVIFKLMLDQLALGCADRGHRVSPVTGVDRVRLRIIRTFNFVASARFRSSNLKWLAWFQCSYSFFKTKWVFPEGMQGIWGWSLTQTVERLQVDGTRPCEETGRAVGRVHVVVTASVVRCTRAELGHSGVVARIVKNGAALVFAPEVVFALVQVDLVPAGVFGHGQAHPSQLRVKSVIGNHHLIAEHQFLKVSSGGSWASSIFQGCWWLRWARSVPPLADEQLKWSLICSRMWLPRIL